MTSTNVNPSILILKPCEASKVNKFAKYLITLLENSDLNGTVNYISSCKASLWAVYEQSTSTVVVVLTKKSLQLNIYIKSC